MRKPLMVEFIGTPEAGKTTSIKNVANHLNCIGYQVLILQESAESLPTEIPKGTWDANLWMHFQTQAGLIKAKFSRADIVLIDRGLVDSNFYGMKFLWECNCTEKEYRKFRMQFMEELFPDFVIALMISPRIAITRRGGEGRLVTERYIENYNEMFIKFYKSIKLPKVLFETSGMNAYEMNQKILTVIQQILL